MKRLMRDTIFSRLFGLAMAAVVVSHIATFILMFVFLGDHRPPPPPGPHLHHHPEPGLLGGPLMGFTLSMLLQLLVLAIAAWIGSRSLARPMQDLAAAASTLGDAKKPTLIPETGPEEARQSALVFNQMQQRLYQQMEERERFLVAVSHDLRTPLTRMKLRIAQIHEDGNGEKLLQDVEEMRLMLDATLEYLRGSEETLQMLDVSSLVAAIVDNMQDEGKAVSMQGTANPLSALPNELRRCLCNLLENAIFYGKSADICLQDSETELLIRISDQGPGIPEQELENVFSPFVRLATSRNKNSGGVGLGLSIAREIARRHRGSLILSNRKEGTGLIAELHLPRH
ncbi:two-component sensor histidine kinase [Undibacterium sp. CY18W]|uniref:histidine kinase n=2 Tax=Undibacterium hunanense TaxID=2762292 RepID=A0ABR6ZS62_9BURK|nr:two-component sensor histidine kinase [Undibacterium hunanense]